MNKIMKATFVTATTATILSPVALVVACTVDEPQDSWSGNHRDLVTTANTTNVTYTQAFAFDGSRSNMGKAVYTIYPTLGRLFDLETTEEVDYDNEFVTDDTSDDFAQFENPVIMPKYRKKYELIDGIALKTGDSENWNPKFPEDYLSEDQFNDPTFDDQLAKAKAVKFHVRDDMHWVYSNGTESKYEITAMDFLHGFRMQGFNYMGSWRAGLDEGKYIDEIKEIEDWLAAFHNVRNMSINRDINNNYLLTLAGIDYKQMYGIDEDNQMIEDKDLTNTNSVLTPDGNGGFEDTLTFNFMEGDYQHNLLFDKIFLDHDVTHGPVPHEYIKEQNEKNFQYEHNLPPESKLAQLGLYTYGFSYQDKLYSGRYYVSENTAFKSVMHQNQHYWDQDWVTDEHTIRSVTQNFRNLDTSLLPMIKYQSYKQGTEYYMKVSDEVSKLPVPDQKDIFENNRVVYDFIQDETAAPNQLGWTSSPIFNDDKAENELLFMNDDYLKAMYGVNFKDFTIENDPHAKKEDQKKGANVYEHWMTYGLALRSQMQSMINWYAVKQLQKGKGDVWNTLTPPGATLTTSGGEEKAAIDSIYTGEDQNGNLIHDNNGLGYDYFQYTKDGQLERKGIVTATEQIDAYKNDKTQNLLAPKTDLAEIEKAMTATLSEIFQDGKDHVLEFSYPLRSVLTSAELRNTYKELANTFESIKIPLTNGGNVSFGIREVGSTPRDSYNPDYNQDISPTMAQKKGPHSYAGWTSDIKSLASWYVGPLVSASWAVAGLMQPFALLSTDNSKLDKDELALKAMLEDNFKISAEIAVDFNNTLNTMISQMLEAIKKDPKKYIIPDNGTVSGYDGIVDSIIGTENGKWKPDVYTELRKLKTNQITGVYTSQSLFTPEQRSVMTPYFLSEVDNMSNIAGSLAFFQTQTWDEEKVLTLEWELRNMAGGNLSFDKMLTPSNKSPEGYIYKSWLTTVTPLRERVVQFKEWRVDEEGVANV